MAPESQIANLADVVRFVLEVDKLKGIVRKVRPVREDRYENAAEHSWQIALFALSLAQTLNPPIDVSRTVAMLLVHDIGEIDAGDKFVFARDGWKEQNAAELKAVERITSLARGVTAAFLLGLWKEFDAGETPEARFARAIDRSMPVLLNLNNEGGSWLENGVPYERVIGRVEPEIESGCPELWNYLSRELKEARRKGYFAAPAS
ncbi:MAG: HD domain-containing protein [Acidobacteriaceae bacterium]